MRTYTRQPNLVVAVAVLVIGLAIFRQASAQSFELDPAPPTCDHGCPDCSHRIPKGRLPGWMGRPWTDPLSGGCRCGKYSNWTNLNFSSAWTSPFSVWLDYGPKGNGQRATADTRNPRLRDGLDTLADVRLLPPVRKDNGHTGFYCDPYGYLGRSWSSPSTATGNEFTPSAASSSVQGLQSGFLKVPFQTTREQPGTLPHDTEKAKQKHSEAVWGLVHKQGNPEPVASIRDNHRLASRPEPKADPAGPVVWDSTMAEKDASATGTRSDTIWR